MALIVEGKDVEHDDIEMFSDSSEEEECTGSEESDIDSFINDETETSEYTTEESEWEESDTDSEPEPKKHKRE
jgi:hypothetical protein